MNTTTVDDPRAVISGLVMAGESRGSALLQNPAMMAAMATGIELALALACHAPTRFRALAEAYGHACPEQIVTSRADALAYFREADRIARAIPPTAPIFASDADA